jgi:hypothetical protein
MTPQEKAQEIYDKLVVHIQRYDEYVDDRSKFNTIQCALIAVDEIISEVYNISHQYTALYDITTSSYLYTDCKELTFWKEVKKEIEKL